VTGALLLCSVTARAHDLRANNQSLDVQAMLTEVGKLYDLDPDLLAAIAQVESAWQCNAESAAGAIGLMQLMPRTAKRFNVGNPYDPVDNALGAARYLDTLRRRYGAAPDALINILAAYNAGPGAVSDYGGLPPYAETREYVRRVLWLYLAGDAPPARARLFEKTRPTAAPRDLVNADAEILDQLQALKDARMKAGSP